MNVALLPPQTIGTSPVTLYTAAGAATVMAAMLVNPTGNASAVTILIKRASGEVVTALAAFPLVGSQAHVATEVMRQTLSAGDSIVAMATIAASVMATLTVAT